MRPKLAIFLVFAAVTAALPAESQSTPQPAASATELAQGARILDGRAGGLEQNVRSARERATQLAEQAAETRARARRAPAEDQPRLEARADELEVQAALIRSGAARSARAASRFRAEARRLRALAKARAGTSEVEPVATGTLSVSSDEGCLVRVDGVPRGTSPLPAFAIAAGVHRIECEAADGRRQSQVTTLRSGAGRTAFFRFRKDDVVSPF